MQHGPIQAFDGLLQRLSPRVEEKGEYDALGVLPFQVLGYRLHDGGFPCAWLSLQPEDIRIGVKLSVTPSSELRCLEHPSTCLNIRWIYCTLAEGHLVECQG